MSTSRDEILDAALQLSESDRLVIANRLLETIPDEPPGPSLDDPEFLDELDRRVRDGSAGIPWSQVRSDLERGCTG